MANPERYFRFLGVDLLDIVHRYDDRQGSKEGAFFVWHGPLHVLSEFGEKLWSVAHVCGKHGPLEGEGEGEVVAGGRCNDACFYGRAGERWSRGETPED